MNIESLILWAGLFIALGAVILLHRIRSFSASIIEWPQIQACVKPESIVFEPLDGLWGRKGRFFRISAVDFEYKKDGCTYKGRKLLPVNWTIRDSERERVQWELETFAVAFCNPTDSSEAYLDIPDRCKRGSISWVTVGLIGAVFMSASLALTLWSRQV